MRLQQESANVLAVAIEVGTAPYLDSLLSSHSRLSFIVFFFGADLTFFCARGIAAPIAICLIGHSRIQNSFKLAAVHPQCLGAINYFVGFLLQQRHLRFCRPEFTLGMGKKKLPNLVRRSHVNRRLSRVKASSSHDTRVDVFFREADSYNVGVTVMACNM